MADAEYVVGMKSSARRDFQALPANLRARIQFVTNNLAANPRPRGVLKLQGHGDYYRLRVGQYRVIYEIDDSARAIRINRIKHRREVYRNS